MKEEMALREKVKIIFVNPSDEKLVKRINVILKLH